MGKLKKVLLAVLLTAGAILSTPKTSLAINWCRNCGLTQDCVSCCICNGNPQDYCLNIC